MPSKNTVYKWLSGLVMAIVSGAIVYLSAGDQSGPGLLAGLMVLLAYLKEHPLPEPNGSVDEHKE